jgi:hypothetical protein
MIVETSRKSCCNAAPLGDISPPGHPNTRRNNSTACGLHRNIDQTPEVSLRGIRIAVGPELNARVSVRCGHLPSRCRPAPHRAMVGMRDFRMSRVLDIAWVSHTPDAVSRLLDCPVSRKGVVFPLNPEPNRLRGIWDIAASNQLRVSQRSNRPSAALQAGFRIAWTRRDTVDGSVEVAVTSMVEPLRKGCAVTGKSPPVGVVDLPSAAMRRWRRDLEGDA